MDIIENIRTKRIVCMLFLFVILCGAYTDMCFGGKKWKSKGWSSKNKYKKYKKYKQRLRSKGKQYDKQKFKRYSPSQKRAKFKGSYRKQGYKKYLASKGKQYDKTKFKGYTPSQKRAKFKSGYQKHKQSRRYGAQRATRSQRSKSVMQQPAGQQGSSGFLSNMLQQGLGEVVQRGANIGMTVVGAAISGGDAGDAVRQRSQQELGGLMQSTVGRVGQQLQPGVGGIPTGYGGALPRSGPYGPPPNESPYGHSGEGYYGSPDYYDATPGGAPLYNESRKVLGTSPEEIPDVGRGDPRSGSYGGFPVGGQ